MKPEIQVPSSHYFNTAYISQDRWLSYWHQINLALSFKSQSVLEVGVGNQIVAKTLKKFGVRMTTLDIDPELKPDVVGSVTEIPFEALSFDASMACEVLEHLPFDQFQKALSEIHRVTKKFVLISLPHRGSPVYLVWKVPLFKSHELFFKIPHFWKKKTSTPEHYWELGMHGFSIKRIRLEIESHGFRIKEYKIYANDPAHCFFVLEKD